MNELLPCPFCGKADAPMFARSSDFDDDFDHGNDDYFTIVCDAGKPLGRGGCGAVGGFFPTEAEAIAAWNRRAPAPVAAPNEPRQGAEPSLRVEIGAVLFPATDGDEYCDPEIEPNIKALEALQERIMPRANSKAVTLTLFVEVAALASGTPAGAPAQPLSDEEVAGHLRSLGSITWRDCWNLAEHLRREGVTMYEGQPCK